MTIFQALFLGILQGFTEFLPVSSSGHLVIAQTFFQFSEPPIFFDVFVHFGTLVAVLVFFFGRLKKLTPQLIKLMIIGTIPALVAGLVIQPYIDTIFTSLTIVAIGLCLTGVLLLSTLLFKKTDTKLSKLSSIKAVIIGIFQALAILPGVSRSGSTVTASLQQGLSQEDAFFFSFLLAIPAIAGALVLQLKDIGSLTIDVVPTLIGFCVSIFSGLLALKLLKLVISHSKLHLFSIYCFGLAIILIGYLNLA